MRPLKMLEAAREIAPAIALFRCQRRHAKGGHYGAWEESEAYNLPRDLPPAGILLWAAFSVAAQGVIPRLAPSDISA